MRVRKQLDQLDRAIERATGRTDDAARLDTLIRAQSRLSKHEAELSLRLHPPSRKLSAADAALPQSRSASADTE